jgi:hypothetical protein
MEYPTLLDLKTRVKQRLDLEDEEFIVDSELTYYFREAVDYVESEIHKLNIEDQYFETVAPLAVVSGVADYTLPSDIYANKIKRVIHNRQDDIYEIKRMTGINRYTDIHNNYLYSSTAQVLSYIIINSSEKQKPVIRLIPRPQFTVDTYTPTINTTVSSKTITVSSATGLIVGQFISSTNVPTNTIVESISGTTVVMSAPATATATGTASTFTSSDVLVYYTRNAKDPTADTDSIDIPEFSNFIVQYVVVECLKKEIGNPRLEIEAGKLEEFRNQMLSTLSNMVPDQRDSVEMDLSIYGEIS